MKMNKKFLVLAILILAVIIVIARFIPKAPNDPVIETFDGANALKHVETQLAFGPRTPGSHAHRQTVEFIQNYLQETDWQVEIQTDSHADVAIQNIIAKRTSAGGPWIIIAAHYDSRFVADQDTNPANHGSPVPGANDGASGVGVLLELARVLPRDLEKNVWLVFFDAEDQGSIPGWDWILGSRSFVNQLVGKPDNVIIIDMIGDADLNLYYEINSDPALSEDIWNTAISLGFEQSFIPENKYRILDDHIPFVQAGITAIDIIDFDYPYWHTLEDTLDKVSGESLFAVGETLRQWLILP